MDRLQRVARAASLVPPSVPQALLAAIQGVVFDVDGVLTDGRITYTDDGHEIKSFHVQDGASIKRLMENDIEVAIITGRRSPIVARRARELGISYLSQGAPDKSAALDELISDGFPSANLAAIGDDLQDLGLFNHPAITCPITVPNGHPYVVHSVAWVTNRSGGEGVAVELAQQILTAQDRWFDGLPPSQDR